MDEGVWRTAGWWRNRPADVRLANCKAPRRMKLEDLSNKPLYDWLANHETGDILTIQSSNTWTAARDAYHLLHAMVSGDTPGNSGRWVSASQYVEMVHDSFSQSGETLPEMYSSPHLLKYMKSVFDVLVLDDLGAEHRTDYSSQVLGDLIKKRYERELTTIITTSSGQLDLAKRYGSRVGAYIGEGTVIQVGRQ